MTTALLLSNDLFYKELGYLTTIFNYLQKNDELSQTLRNAIARINNDDPVMVNPDDSWVVCRIYKKKQHIAGRVQVPFFDFIGQGGPEGTATSSSVI